jgi:predicted Fe-Mo cluster-binding NifX family protein
MKVQKAKVRVVKANQSDVEFAIKKVTMRELAQIKRNLLVRT